MSTNQKSNEEEVDLGSLFVIIGKGFSKFFNFIASIFKGVFHAIISILIFLKQHIVKIGIAAIIGGGLGVFLEVKKPDLYGSELIVSPNFKSTRQLYDNIHYYNNLVKQKDVAGLERTFNLDNPSAISLRKFAIEPIVNENDTVTTEDLKVGDNDNLSALVAQVCDADCLFILSDIDGVFTKDPNIHSDAVLLPVIDEITDEIYAMAGTSRNHLSTGGMKTKIEAAEKATEHGINTYILNGTKSEVFASLLAQINPGTRFCADKDVIKAKKHWLKHTLKSQGRITLDSGAVNALVNKGASLLPAGIKSISQIGQIPGSFCRICGCIEQIHTSSAAGLAVCTACASWS